MGKKIRLKDVKDAEREYSNSLFTWGEYNQTTIRALIKWKDLKKVWEETKKRSIGKKQRSE